MRKIISLICMSVIVLTLCSCGCGGAAEETTTEIETETETETTTDNSTPDEVKSFVDALETENYKELFDLCDLPENSVVCEDDISYWIKRSEFAPILGQDNIVVLEAYKTMDKIVGSIQQGIDEPSGETAEGETETTVNDNPIYEFTFQLDDDDNYALVLDGAFSECDFYAPGGVTITINDVVLDEEKWAGEDPYDTYGIGDVIYKIYCPAKQMIVNVQSDIGEYDTVSEWVSEDDETGYYTILNTAISSDISNVVLTEIQDRLNQMFTAVHEGKKDVADFEEYFSKDTSSGEIYDFVNFVTSPNIISEETSTDSTGASVTLPQLITITELRQSDKDISYIGSNDTIVLNTMLKDTFGTSFCTFYVRFVVKKEQGQWLIKSTDLMEKTNFTKEATYEW